MRFVNFKIPAETLAARVAELRAGFESSGKPGTFEENALRVIAARLRARPQDYVEFGPYWWAVKAALAEAGYDFGDDGDALVAAEYRGADLAETLVAAEGFKDMHRATYFAGHNTYDLADDGGSYELIDPDMLVRVPAGG